MSRVRRMIRLGLVVATLGLVSVLLLQVAGFLRVGGVRFAESSRQLLERAQRVLDVAGPGYQERVLRALPANPLNGPTLRLDDRLHEAVATAAPDTGTTEGDDGVLLGLEFEDPRSPGLVTVGSRAQVGIENGVLRVMHDPEGHLELGGIAVAGDDVAELQIRARLERGTRMTFSWQGEGEQADEWENNFAIDVLPGERFHTYSVNAQNALKRGLERGERITKILLRPSNVAGDRVEIDYVRLISKLAKYRRQPHGVAYESQAGEMRRVLYMFSSHSLRWSARVPEASPRLEFGIGMLRDGVPVEFAVSVREGAETTRLLERRVAMADGWHDFSFDMSRWAGRDVEITLLAEQTGPNVAFWSNPILTSSPVSGFNVIMILEDTLRADHLSAYGYPLPTSPFKDELSEKGILFVNAFSQATMTRPSVPSLMTSLLPTATGVWNFSDILRDEYLTLAEILRSQGFATASFIQNGHAGPYNGLHQGFDVLLDEEILGSSTEEILGERLWRWLDGHADRNFFLYLHVRDPHGPYDPPPPFDEWYHEAMRDPAEAKAPALPPDRRWHDPEWVERPTRTGRRLLYDGEIRHNDFVLNGLLERLESLGLRERTLLVFLSDHGEYLGEHGLWEHHPPGYRQVVHVPLQFVYPAGFTKAQRIEESVQLMDVMPTVLELAGVDSTSMALQGDSLLGLIEGDARSYWANRITVSEEPTRMRDIPRRPCGCGSLFFRRWHLLSSKALPMSGLPAFLRWRISERPLLRVRAFDLREDPEEVGGVESLLLDLHLRYRFGKTLDALQASNIEAWRRWTGGSAETISMDPDVQERLRAIGYLE